MNNFIFLFSFVLLFFCSFVLLSKKITQMALRLKFTENKLKIYNLRNLRENILSMERRFRCLNSPHHKQQIQLLLAGFVVEHSGLEPLTSTLPVLRSTRWASAPCTMDCACKINTNYWICKYKARIIAFFSCFFSCVVFLSRQFACCCCYPL